LSSVAASAAGEKGMDAARRVTHHAAAMDATRRFSDRVVEYAQFRPGYPDALFDELLALLPAGAGVRAADIGSGTGLFSAGLLARGVTVLGVEPNAEMRAAAEQAFAAELSTGRFLSVNGRAEATSVPEHSVSLVTAAQAFHWFDAGLCRVEWRRISSPGGHVALVWNEREQEDEFHAALAACLASSGNTLRDERRDERRVAELFAGGWLETRHYSNQQELDWAGLRGRVLSSSYVPLPGAPGHDPLFRELRRLFEAHAQAGQVRLRYTTRLHVGQLGGAA
jgi:SAM-dependent methyltransferase